MGNLFRITLDELESVFHELEGRLESPEFIADKTSPMFRNKKKTREIAILLKSARIISGLNASLHLLPKGFVQEIGVICRTIDESYEDILFLLKGYPNELSEIQKKFLDEFYQEEFDNPESPLQSTQKRNRVPRKKIQAEIGRIMAEVINPSDGQELFRTISKTFSGFVHSAYSHIMDLYGGVPGKFRYHLNGMPAPPKINELIVQMEQYVYRGILAMMLIMQAFGHSELFGRLLKLRGDYEEATGKTKWDKPKDMIKRLKK